jgi:uncharacterized protein YecE (DUF72 family)
MAASKIYIGTSGWSYKHWKEIFYPPKNEDYRLPFFLRKNIYTPFHGPAELYASSYSDETLKTFGHKI